MADLFALGGVDLRSDDERLDAVLSQPKRTALLVYLALARPRGFHARDTLLALFWPESDRKHARSSLRKALHFLRLHLGRKAVLSSGDAVGLSSGVQCDAVAFEGAIETGELREALALYRGELLHGFHVSNAPDFERWLDGERRRIRRSAVRAAWELAEEEEAAGRRVEAARYAHRAHAIDPLDELGLRQLMGLLHRLGDRPGALRAYRRAERRLREVLDTEPTAETRALRDRIREGGVGSEPATAAAGEIRSREAERTDTPAEPAGNGPTNPTDESVAVKVDADGKARSGSVVRSASSFPRLAVASVLAAALVLGGGLSVQRIASGVGDADAERSSTFAVLPFDVAGEERPLWREGMATLLSTTLNGASGLRALEPETVAKAWRSEFPDSVSVEATVEAFGRRLGAGWIVSGTLTRHGARMRLAAEARNVVTGEEAGPAVVDGPRDSLFSLVDRLTVELLRAGMSTGDGEALSAPLSRVTTGSLRALEAYLEGERAWRSARIRPAGVAYSRAIQEDPGFALAHLRRAIVGRWLGPDHDVVSHLRSAVRHAGRLHSRELSIARGMLALRDGRIRIGLDTLRALTARDPTFAEGWTRLGYALLEFGPRLYVPREEARRAFLRALELDPRASEPYWPLMDDAFFREDSSEAERLIEAYRSLDPQSGACVGYETAYMLTWGSRSEQDRGMARLDTLGGGRHEPLTCALTVLVLAPSHRPALDLVVAELTSPDRPTSQGHRAMAFRTSADVSGGRIAAARNSLTGRLGELAHREAATKLLLLDLVAYPDARASEAAREALQRNPGAADRFWLGAWALHHGQSEEARRQGESLRRSSEARNARHMADALSALSSPEPWPDSIVAVLDTAQLRIVEDPMIGDWLRLRIGRSLLESGEPSVALRYLESMPMHAAPLTAPSLLLRGRAHEALADTAEARKVYHRFLRWWQEADPPLAPLRREASEALTRLGA